jgi:CspA family cold shock protein
MSTSGIVRVWHSDDGWGVIDSTETPGGCWASFGVVAMEGFRELEAGLDVEFEWETVEQDGYAFRATRAWPTGLEPFAD